MKLSKIIPLFLTLFFVILILGGSTFVKAQGTGEFVEIDNPLEAENIGQLIDGIGDLLRVLAIGVGVIMVIYSGIMIMTAGGSEEKITKGKKMLTWTIIGVAIVIAADFIKGFILELIGGLGG